MNQWPILRNRGTDSNLADVGRDAVLANLIHGEATPVVVANVVPGDRGEDLRRTRGDAAGEELGAVPVDRHAVNMGTCDTRAHEMSECIEEVRLMPEV